MRLRNIILALKDQLPIKRAFRNFFITGNALDLFYKRSHSREDGKSKQSFPTKESAMRDAESTGKNTESIFQLINVCSVMDTT